MINTYYYSTVPMIPGFEKMDCFSGDGDVTNLDVPKIYFDGMRDLCEEECAYNWIEDSLVMAKDDHIVKFTECATNEVLLKDENGERVWIDGAWAQDFGFDVAEREDIRVLREYFVEVYDLKKGEKLHGKVTFEEASPMSGYNLAWLKKRYSADDLIGWNGCVEISREKMMKLEEEFRELEEAYPAESGEVVEDFVF